MRREFITAGRSTLRVLWIRGFALWITHAVDYGPVGPVDYASRARCGLGGARRGGGWLRPHTHQAGLSPARFTSCGCPLGAHGVSSAFGRMGYFSCLCRGASAGFGVSPSFVGRAFVEACPLMPQEREALRERCRGTSPPAAPLIVMRLHRTC